MLTASTLGVLPRATDTIDAGGSNVSETSRPRRAFHSPELSLMSWFTSDRERRLWFWALAVVVAIYSTLGLAGTLAEALRERNQLDDVFFACFLVVVAAILGSGLLRRPGRLEIWVELGVFAVYATVVLRMATDPAHRTHLFEYGLVAVLIYQALAERRRGGGRVRAPAALALGLTVLLGWLDEGIQWILPNRVYDIVDVGFNALAGFMAIAASLVLARARAAVQRRRLSARQ